MNLLPLLFYGHSILCQMDSLPLKEMYCEQNPLLEYKPVHSVQEEEVLSLKVRDGTNTVRVEWDGSD